MRVDNRRLAEWLLVTAVLLTAVYLRVGSPGIVEYKRDEANLSQLALDFVHGGDLPLLGIGSSVGIPNAPVNVYILAIPYLFDSNPLYATQFIGLLNVFAIGLTYWFARRYCDPFAAALTALVFAVSPWGIIFSRKIWAQNMLPPFVLLTVITGVIGFIEHRRWAQVVHLPLLVFTGQIHYGAFVLIPVSVYLVWGCRKQMSRAFAVSVALAGLLMLPYAIGMLRAGFDSLGVMRERVFSSTGTQSLALTFEALRSAALVIAGTEIHSLAGPERFQEFLDSVPNVYWLLGLLSWLVVVSMLWIVVRSIRFRDSRTPVDIVLLIWISFPVLIFSITWTPFYIHYLIPIFPAAYLILGFAISDLWYGIAQSRHLRAIVMASCALVLGMILVFQVWIWLSLLHFVNTHFTPNGFGTPLHYLLDVRNEILKRSPEQVLASVGGQALIFDDEPTVWRTLLYDVPIVRFVDNMTHVYPIDDVVYLTNQCNGEAARFALRENEGCYALLTRSADDFDPTGYEIIPNTVFANGVHLLWYRWHEACLSLVWQITSLTTQDYMFAVHFVDDQDQRLVSADGLSWFGTYWRLGDLVRRDFCLPEIHAAFVDVGMYTYEDGNFFNVDLLDTNHTPIGQSIRLPLR